ncbi:hypothetical protein K503DRAFT_165002 [Rhizopogon vinicolor AM-OR11-026]|uniref:Uncharacterized protein n=1 Tax=Rhizopogon vinicolor AM-OR11-026 TaxID=1314800 RepID=A0A1B7N0I5_9AGAM|nr:hypothetical protein K503DRAFT_165002 [Rhizopogon vinicolor AM-OR11-026]
MKLRSGSDCKVLLLSAAPISGGCLLSWHFNILSATRESPRYIFCIHSHHPRRSYTASQPCQTD